MKRLLPLLCLCLVLLITGGTAETLTLSFVGDCTIGEQWCYRNYKTGYCSMIKKAGLDYPFSKSAYLFADDDLTVANCEVCFTSHKPADANKAMSLCASKEFAEVFKLGNVDVVNITNNHSSDFGNAGKKDTREALESFGISYFGDEYLYEVEIKGVRIGIVGHRFNITDYTMKQYKEQFDQLRADGCTFIIASVHWGREDTRELNSQQIKYGEMMIDLGADMVYGHGSHTIQPVEYYNGHLILYSTGNFTFGANSRPWDMDTGVFQVLLDKAEDGTVTTAALKVYPYCVCYKGDFCPYPYTEKKDQERMWSKLVFSGKNKREPQSNLPESILTTGYAAFMDAYADHPTNPMLIPVDP